MKAIHKVVGSIGLVFVLVACSQPPTADTTGTGPEPAKKVAAAATAPVTADPPAPAAAAAVAAANEEHCDGKNTVEDSIKVETIAVGTSATRGSVDAPVTLVVFSDFQCPYCSKAEKTVREVEAAYPGKVRVVFKNAPLPFHEHAKLAAKASLAAKEQGMFWEYHDALFAQQDALDRPSLEKVAQKLGLDLPKFRAALDSPKLDAAIDADLAEAKRVDVKGVPAFFINGRNLQGAQPLAAFKTKVDLALAER
jgi:protein-disulfide isomerase